MKFILQIILLFSIFNIIAQTEGASQENFTHKLEELILETKTDSTNYYLKQLKESSYKSILEKIVFKKEVSYAEYYRFTSRTGNRRSINYKKVSNYINSFVEEPINKKKIDLDYVSIKWTQVSKLRDEGDLNEASKIQTTLDDYVNKFNDSEIEVLAAKTKITTHQIVMYLIQKDTENGKKLVLKGLETAKKLNDKELQIIFLYHLSDFLIEERKLQEYIDVSEQSLQLDKELTEHSSYYHSTIEHLIDAYIYKGGNNKRVVTLINELYDFASTRIHTYTLYTKLVSHLKKDSPLINEVLNKFEVKNVPELVSKFQVLGKDLNSNDFFHLVNGSSIALEAHGHYDLALRYKQKAIDLTQKIYWSQI
ncbi:MAG: hypothetical protein V3V28_03050 [Polaribacter sp.]|uniref:hypothetical protein n=1 Tax=Polaribacter sp. TaxID=1920175 RepID=UPI002F354EB3